MDENAALLEPYLAIAGDGETALPGGCVMVREEGSETPVVEESCRRRLRAAASERELRRVATSRAARPGFAGPRRGKARYRELRFPPEPGIGSAAVARLTRPPADLAQPGAWARVSDLRGRSARESVRPNQEPQGASVDGPRWHGTPAPVATQG